MQQLSTPDVTTDGRRCVYCQTPIGGEATARPCEACGAFYHPECWEENDGCAVYGCEGAARVAARGALEIPISYWGKETKPCPQCRAVIQATAQRCRHCGAMFHSARPVSTGEFQQRHEALEMAPTLRKATGWLFVFCLLPPSAPLAVLFGALWYRRRRHAFESLPPIYSALVRLGIAIGLTQIVIVTVLALVYAVSQAR